ncbi:MAG: RrF2 family transcriptional regulator [Oscillospiraceae bacterium]
MMISTRGRYALRVLIDLAEHSSGNRIPMKEIAQRQGISLKYLERILPVLSKNDLISGVNGKGGGYMLCRRPEEYTVGEILRLTEGELAPVACLEANAAPCKRADECSTLKMWSGFYKITNTNPSLKCRQKICAKSIYARFCLIFCTLYNRELV